MNKIDKLNKTTCGILSSQKNNENNSNTDNSIPKSNDSKNNNNYIDEPYSFSNLSHNNDIASIQECNEGIGVSKTFNIKTDLNILKSLLQKSKISIDIVDKKVNNMNISFFVDKSEHNLKYKEICQNIDYKIIESEGKDKESKIIYKNFKRLLIFLNEIEEYINSSNLNLNHSIEIELKKQNTNINENSKIKENQDIYTINCIYIHKEILEDKKIYFIDRNILINGIYGKTNGFAFLINELLNEYDY